MTLTPATLAARPGVLTGVLLAACGYAMFSFQDAAVKWLVTGYTVPEILLVRSAVIMVIALAAGGGAPAVKRVRASRNKVALVVRAALIFGAWLSFYAAAAEMGLAELTTLYFAAPVVAVTLSAVALKERVDAGRWAPVLIGFVGVLVAVGPIGGFRPWPTALALVAAVCWGTSTVMVRWIGRSDTTLTQMLSSNALFALCCLPVLPWMWHAPTVAGLGLMIGIGVAGGIGQYLLFESFRHAPASVVAPVEYGALVWAFLYGYAIWGEIPHWNTFLGAGLIVASSSVLVWVEDRRRRRAAP